MAKRKKLILLILASVFNFIIFVNAFNCTNVKVQKPFLTSTLAGCTFTSNLSDIKLTSLQAADPDTRVAALKQSFCCSHSKPIKWVIDADLTHFSFKKTYYERLKVANTSFKFNYVSEFLFIYELEDLQKPLKVSCQPVIYKSPCEWSFIQVTRGKYAAFFNAVDPHEILLANEKNSTKNHSTEIQTADKNETENPCKFTLFVKQIKGNLLEYKWEDALGRQAKIQKAICTNCSIYFENLFRNVPQNKSCVNILKQNETCKHCRLVSKDVINAVVFYAKDEAFEMVLKGLFSIVESLKGFRNFSMEWEMTNLKMIHMEELPKVLYVNQTYSISCNVSSFYFSYGTYLKSTQDPVPDFSETTEICRENGNIEAIKEFVFTESETNKTIGCFAPFQKSSYWIYNSRTVNIECPQTPIMVNGSSYIKEQNRNKTNSFKKSTCNDEKVDMNFHHYANGSWNSIKVRNGEENVTIVCEATGNPLPVLEWELPIMSLQPKLLVTNESYENERLSRSQITFPNFTLEFQGVYKCVGVNIKGKAVQHFDLILPQFQRTSVTENFKLLIITTLGILTSIFVGVLFVLKREVKLQKKKYQKETEWVRKEFMDGIPNSKYDELCPLQMPILSRPYNKDYEIPYEKWAIDDQTLGEGEFGLVKRGVVETESKTHQVAIKMLKPSSTLEDFKGFLLEIKVMEFVGYHPNVISLLACCTQNFDRRDVLIGVEFCPNGCLRTYMLERKNIYQKREDPNNPGTFGKGHYGNLVHSSLTEVDLYTWAFQIAQGMEYLASKNVLHGDLAVRNILLKADKVAKISDFGLSRFLNEHGNYMKRSVRVPWKLMPPEALKFLKFSTASDVWAYGITLWELFTLGEIPYPGVNYDQHFIKNIERGMRLPHPPRAPKNIYGIMTRCWSPKPFNRPNFTQLKSAFSKIIESINKNERYRISQEIFSFSAGEETVKVRIRNQPVVSNVIITEDDLMLPNPPRRLNAYSNVSNISWNSNPTM